MSESGSTVMRAVSRAVDPPWYGKAIGAVVALVCLGLLVHMVVHADHPHPIPWWVPAAGVPVGLFVLVPLTMERLIREVRRAVPLLRNPKNPSTDDAT